MIIINADKITLTGNKLANKFYYRHSGYQGGLTVRTAKQMRDKQPERMLELAVKGMLPKGRLGRQWVKNYLFMLDLNIHTQHKNLKFTNFVDN